MAKTDLNKILQVINNHEYEDLDKFLKKTDWFSVPKDSILPRAKVRAFVTSIADDEVRLSVMRFLQKYEDHYFKEEDNGFTPVLGADPITAFHKELAVQIEQLTSTGEFSGDKFSKLQKRVNELEKQVEELKAENKKLTTKVDKYEHPYRHRLFIPEELQEEEFLHIMKYLQSKQIAMPYQDRNEYGLPHVACYLWCDNASKALFGYFADRVSYELDLYKDKHIQWKIFRPVFVNFKELEKQAKDVVSKYKSWANPQVPLPKGYEIIDAAVKYAEEQMDKEGDKPAVKNHKVIGNRM